MSSEANSVSIAARRALDLRFIDLLEKVRQIRPNENLDLLRKAYDFASEQHAEQQRDSGEPYLSHPLAVAHLLADMRLDVATLSAALLHDIVEDTKIPSAKIAEQFGEEVARLVEGTTKIGRLDLLAPEARQAENVRKMLLAMVNDVRVVLIKLADRLHNMRTLDYLPAERQQRISRETLGIYAPIAHRLGMGAMRGELEDLSFSYLEPQAYLDLRSRVESKRKFHEKFLSEVQEQIRKTLEENGIPAEVEGRIKRLYSIHLKSQRQQRTLDQIYDLLAVRVITDTVRNCYAALGVIHQIWPPVPGRFKDYIAMPRPNLYQSLHSTVIRGGQPLEVQIRTQEMHRIAEYGVCAHWRYKEGPGGQVSPRDEQRVAWLRQLIEWVQEMEEPSEFLSTLSVDLYPEEVYTFTPKGHVIVLPRDATPIDFAYAIHTEVGHECVGAKVNSQVVPLRHPLANGDVVEILTQKGHAPSRDWLSFVHTSRARSKIRQWINLQESRRATEVGRRLLEKEAREHGLSLKKLDRELVKVASDYGCSSIDDLCASIGYGKLAARQVLAKTSGEPLAEKRPPETPKLASTVKRMLGMHEPAVLVRGQDDVLVFRASCCNPIPGDDIVGYITRGRGVAVHHANCPNVQNLLYETERRIVVEWAPQSVGTYSVRLRVYAEDKPGVLAGITASISEAEANIRSLESTSDDLRARIEILIDLTDHRQLDRIVASIRRVPGIFDVERVYNV
ncbi:MAG TPA: bifunctional (p)ppGpp synthetase/guanosine-3',5'-bis(diphosphate) 3'-pyrophosphohydrolase [Candidatus Dormibacteraeota bacterium]|nr:bifunctional (p)ppGpp synthetase/guanosine-3',5'-bis(diphosphate) 3'-pyrophosphohydrolase [Candidatus Dormibacteraeota bacterium]